MNDNKIHEIRVIRKSQSEVQKNELTPAPQKKEGEEKFIEWEAPEYGHFTKDTGWFVWSAVIAALLIFFGMVTDSLLFIVIVIIAELLLLFWTTEKPAMIRYIVNEKGVTINDRLILYPRLSWFALAEEREDRKKLVIEQRAKFAPRIQAIWVPTEAEENIRTIFQNKLEESTEYEDRLVDTIARLIKF